MATREQFEELAKAYTHLEMSLPSLLDTQQLAEVLHVQVRTLSYWRENGDGPVFTKYARKIVYAREDVIAWLRTHRRQSTSRVNQYAKKHERK